MAARHESFARFKSPASIRLSPQRFVCRPPATQNPNIQFIIRSKPNVHTRLRSLCTIVASALPKETCIEDGSHGGAPGDESPPSLHMSHCIQVSVVFGLLQKVCVDCSLTVAAEFRFFSNHSLLCNLQDNRRLSRKAVNTPLPKCTPHMPNSS